MLIVRGTAAFRERVPGTPASPGDDSRTELGPWYAGIVRRRRPLALFINERTLLPVVVPLAPAKTLLARLPDAVSDVLSELDIPADFIAAEAGRMAEARVTPTMDRGVNGILTNQIRLLDYRPDADPLELSLWLGERPVGRKLLFPVDEVRAAAGVPPRRPRPIPPADSSASPFPTSVEVDGRRIRIEHQPGLADDLMRDLRPLLLADGIDLDDEDHPPAIADLQAAMARAVERRNLELFTPVGTRRDNAVVALIVFTTAVDRGADDAATSMLEAIVPESPGDKRPEVAAVTGLALALLDEWLTGEAAGVPNGLARSVRLPPQWKKAAPAAPDMLALAARGRAFDAHGSLIVRRGGAEVLTSAAVALAAAVQAWSRAGDVPVETLLPRIVR